MSIMINSAVVSALIEYMNWQHVLGHFFYSYILWHMLLFAIVLMIFYDSRHGFRKTISIFTKAFYFVERNKKNNALNYTVSKYRERSKKVYLNSAILAVAVTLTIASALYFEFIFFSVVISDSMNPTLKKGDLILMQNIMVKPKMGDIITLKVTDELSITHRIISISGNEIRLKGDANPSEDPWRITKSQIEGKIVCISGKPVVLRNLGNYFLVDASRGGIYGPEFNAISKVLRWVKSAGIVIFIMCIILYLAFSVRGIRRTRW